jgi:hypothetical protein
MAPNEMVWHNDDHKIHLRINRSEIEIVEVECPHGDNGECHTEYDGCAVIWFLDRYGLECNAGSCPASETLQICWTLSGDNRDMESCQLWFMPLTDETFQAWLTTKTQ